MSRQENWQHRPESELVKHQSTCKSPCKKCLSCSAKQWKTGWHASCKNFPLKTSEPFSALQYPVSSHFLISFGHFQHTWKCLSPQDIQNFLDIPQWYVSIMFSWLSFLPDPGCSPQDQRQISIPLLLTRTASTTHICSGLSVFLHVKPLL